MPDDEHGAEGVHHAAIDAGCGVLVVWRNEADDRAIDDDDGQEDEGDEHVPTGGPGMMSTGGVGRGGD